MTTKDLDGFTIRRTGLSHPYYHMHQYVVDGYTGDDAAPDNIDTCRTKKEALALVRAYRKGYERIRVYDEWREEEIDGRNGRPIVGDIVSQTFEDYIDGKPTKTTMP